MPCNSSTSETPLSLAKSTTILSKLYKMKHKKTSLMFCLKSKYLNIRIQTVFSHNSQITTIFMSDRFIYSLYRINHPIYSKTFNSIANWCEYILYPTDCQVTECD